MVYRSVLVLILAAVLAGCASTPETIYKTVTVSVPVPVKAKAPDTLIEPYTPVHLPKFTSPADPAAKVALSAEDLNHLKTLLRTLVTRDEAWRAWANGESN